MENGFENRVKNGIDYLVIPSFEKTGIVSHMFSTRNGGCSDGSLSSLNLGFNRGDKRENVIENYHRVCEVLDVDFNSLVLSAQTHTDNVEVVGPDDCGRGISLDPFKNVDALITGVPGITLVTFYADCVPLFFLDPVLKVVALAHSGWKGTKQKIGKAVVERMKEEFGCNPSDILCGIGPSAGPCCYEVSDQIALDMIRTGRDGNCALYNPVTEKFHADLWKTNSMILKEAGIPDENITVSRECTVCHPEKYYSYRVQGNERGSMAAFIALKG